MRRFEMMCVALLTSSIGPTALYAQVGAATPRASPDVELHQNYPNPFDSETTLPFVLRAGLFEDAASAVVSIRIRNSLFEFVASPVADGHPAGEGVRVLELEYSEPGEYEAVWDGKDMDGVETSAGVYRVELSVAGRRTSRLMYRARTEPSDGGGR